jgi:hypothetical protein
MECAVGRHQPPVTKIWNHGRSRNANGHGGGASSAELKNGATLHKIGVNFGCGHVELLCHGIHFPSLWRQRRLSW